MYNRFEGTEIKMFVFIAEGFLKKKKIHVLPHFYLLISLGSL